MPYDPNWPPTNAELLSAPFREQFQGLKALIDAQAVQIAALIAQVNALAFSQVPIGGVVPWHKDTPGTPALPANFVECNGQTLNDPASPLDGIVITDYNNIGRFPRGGLASDITGGIDAFGQGTAEAFVGGTPLNVISPDFSPGASPFPLFVTAVFVMRVK